MKLIIDIPEKLYSAILGLHKAGIASGVQSAIANGVPLEDIKAEIETHIINEYTGQNEYEIALSDGLELALQIIDKHISGKESE